jgi:formylglycine-generating enzyme required for sulfatase activity
MLCPFEQLTVFTVLLPLEIDSYPAMSPTNNRRQSSAAIRHTITAFLSALSFFVSGSALAQDTVSWNNSAGGDWNTATNWSPARVPTTNDIAVISLPGTYTVTLSSGTAAPTSLTVGGSNAVVTLQQAAGTLAPQQASTFLSGSTYSLAAGSLSGAGDLTINGAFTSTGGTLSTGGKLVLAEGCTSVVSGGFSKEVGRVVENRGTLTVNGSWEFIASGLVDNQATGTLIFNGGGIVARTSGSPGGVRNTGLIIRRGTGTTSINNLPLNNLSGGEVRIEAGVLALSAGGTIGMVQSTGGSLALNGGTHILGAGDSVAAPISVNNSTLTINNASAVGFTSLSANLGSTVNCNVDLTLASLTLDSSDLGGSGNVTVTSTFNWTTGSLLPGGELVLAQGCTSILNGSFSKAVRRVVKNSGTLTYNGSQWNLGDGGRVNNLTGGTLNLNGNGGLTRNIGGTNNAINNEGLILRSGTGTTSINDLPLNNLSGGEVRITSGTLQPSGGFNQSGIVSGTGILAASFTNNGTIRPDAVPGGLTISGNLTQGSAGRVELTLGGRDATLGHRSLTVSGVSGIANFAGSLSITRSASFAETNGASFEVIRFASRTNDFSSAEGLGPVSGVALRRSFTTTSLNLTVGLVPELSVGSGLSGKVGVSTNYNVTATGTGPISFSASNLPAGLNINSGTGTIAGTPTTATNGSASVVASNNFGAVTNPLSWTIAKGSSVINSLPTASAIAAGQALSASALSGGSANVAGAFTWTDESLVPAGSGSYSATFIPNDFANYETATTDVPVVVMSTNANLDSLVISSGALTPAFSGGETSYAASVDYDTASITVAPTVSDTTAAVAVNGVAVTSGTASTAISLNVGPNTINVLVTAEDPATTKTYTLTVTRAQETVAPVITLIGENPLTVKRGSSFTDPGADVTDNVDAPRKISGTGSVNTSVAATYTLTYSATDAAGNVATPVTRTVNVVNSTNANLSALTISSGSLSPAFAGTTTDYAANVSFSVASVTVTPTVADPTASVTVNGSSNLTDPISLNVGDNTITVLVTAQDGTTTKSYTITVTRAAASTNANLSALTISSGSLSPAFAGDSASYTAAVSNSVTSIVVSATVSDPTASVTVNGSSNLSNPINLNVGDNTITVLVTAQDGTTTKTYTITVSRAALSTNANLSGLTISSGSLSPSFSSNMTAYTANLDNTVATITVTPTASDGTATITLNGSSITSGSARTVTLDIGSNQIPIVVTAQDGVTTKPYSITVTRASASVTPWTEAFGSGTNTFTIDFVDIGNTNNPADASGYGAVPYGYRVAAYEIPQDAISKAAASGLSNVTAGAWTGNRPAANVSWLEAAAFVNWLNTSKGYQRAYNMVFTNGAWTVQPWSSADAWTVGGTNLYRHKDAYYFLPNENEWYKAAYYDAAATNYFPYPTASSKAPTDVGGGTTINTAVYNSVTNTPAEVANAGGLSPYGTMGQGGNVTEWNESTVDGSTNSTIRVVRGGSWSASAAALLSSTRSSASQTDKNSAAGFRVASVQPRPSQGFTDWAQGAPLTLENLLKYAFGGASGPDATDGIPMIPSVGATNLCVTVIVRTNDSLLTVSAQNIGNLSTGTWGSGSVTRTSDGIDQTGVPAGFQRQRFCAPHGGDGREFIRVQAGLTPPVINNLITVQGGTLPSSSALSGAVVATFQITKYEVTWHEWQEVRDWAVANGYTDLAGVGAGSTGNHPVSNVSWLEATKWCNAKSEKEGLSPVYEVGGTIYRAGLDEPTANSSANGYRLPTEAEWDWAARGGQSSQGYVYSGSNDVNAVAWYSNNSGAATKEVGTKSANELGIHDMSGNVIELCEDLVFATLPGGAQGRYRRGRGGSSFSQPNSSTQVVEDAALARKRSDAFASGYRAGGIGFRLARKGP